ncbi:cytochrome c oxidase assembly protein [Lichenifustis flavocetrariae]|uniref:Cytochrome c oxidase assembly protein CtaG n=1 Tax=Lichenifustis flavocetrariae TaxID=2949735 RepID=A0AA41Z0R3_9HYPH|nr:cytochrome c oxidase assembly protein [Lichenifustis flavocetrariae]MCW6510678.1 cytochrome c oxidase assembly protein [Lichenifustis flavocetrariae]
MRPASPRHHRATAFIVASVFFGMIGLTYASVPLYRAFCNATGFGGTTQVAKSAPAKTGARVLTVRFDGNVGGGLPWTFEPETASIDLRTGQTATVYYKVRNDSGRITTGRAEYNVTPEVTGAYFDKIACFCFSDQTIGPGETIEMPVVFFLDPALEKDKSMVAVDSVTLSYTFYPVRDTDRPVATNTENGKAAPDKKL